MDNYVLGILLSGIGSMVNSLTSQIDSSDFSKLIQSFKNNRLIRNQSKNQIGNLADRGFPSSYTRR